MVACTLKLVLFITPATVTNATFFPQHGNKELAVIELFETLDFAGSIIYIRAAHMRASHSAGARECADGHWVTPVLLPSCPVPADILAPCANVSLGAPCEAALGSCALTPDDVGLGNCPALGVPPTRAVFRKEPSGDAAQRIKIVWWLMNAALLSYMLAEAVACPLVTLFGASILYPDEDGISMYCAALCCLISVVSVVLVVAYLPAVLFANLMPSDEGVLALLIIVISVKVLSLVLDCTVAFCCPADTEGENLTKAVAVLKLPFLGTCMALKMTPGGAAEVTKFLTCTKVALRLVYDIPEAAISIVDMATFGASWWAALNVAGSASLVVYWLAGRLARCMLALARRVMAVVGYVVGNVVGGVANAVGEAAQGANEAANEAAPPPPTAVGATVD